MSATCDECGRTVPPEEAKDGPYVDYRGMWHCGTCIVDMLLRVERWWGELKDTIPSETDLAREAFLRQLGFQR